MRINGATLKAIRTLNGYGLRELAGKSGVSVSYLSELENGRDVNVRPPTMRKLADALGVPVAALARDPSTVVEVA